MTSRRVIMGCAAAVWLAAACGEDAPETPSPAPAEVPTAVATPPTSDTPAAAVVAPASPREAPAPTPSEAAPTPDDAAPAAPAAAPGPTGDAGAVTPVAERADVVLKVLDKDGDKTLADLLAAEIAVARGAGSGTVVMFSASWCEPCHVLHDLLVDNPVVRAKAAGGHFVEVSTDTWPRDAHTLIEGATPNPLPLLVRVDGEGRPVRSRGAGFGFGDEGAVGDALAELIWGANAETRQVTPRAPPADNAPFVIREREDLPGKLRLTLDVMLENQDASRRWFVLPTHGEELSAVRFSGRETEQFGKDGEVFATRFDGKRPLTLVSVAGWGRVYIKGLVIEVPRDQPVLSFWKLVKATVDGEPLRLEGRAPYDATVEDAGDRLQVARAKKARGTLQLDVADTNVLLLQAQ